MVVNSTASMATNTWMEWTMMTSTNYMNFNLFLKWVRRERAIQGRHEDAKGAFPLPSCMLVDA